MNKNFPGLDTEDGISRFGGNEALYFEMLQVFSEQHKNSVERIETLLKSSNLDEAINIIHEINGTSGILGLHLVNKSAAALEEAIEQKKNEEWCVFQKPFYEALNAALLTLGELAKADTKKDKK